MSEAEIIESGVLLAYCLGLLTIEEEKNVETMCNTYLEVAKELQLTRLELEKQVDTNTIANTRVELRKAVWEALKKSWKDKPQ